MEGVASGTRQSRAILQVVDWESVATKNKTKATLYDELIERLPMEMGELLEEARVTFKRWHFE